ncbi:Calx-beta domain-containing protein [Longispora albida]|uniref:Calx-beta domain-containing protein n=1 Tax=Longispora albida TaxID=203523 RepID=UPI00036BADB4|nr:Calx-beta domain-containing protein [Longispora albida]
MRFVPRLMMVAAAAALTTLGMMPSAQAANPSNVFTVNDGWSYEYEKSCQSTAPFACTSNATSLSIMVSGAYPGKSYAITLGYQVEAVSATAGVDYVASTGTVTIPAGNYRGYLSVPLVNDGLAEGTETFRIRLTSSSAGGNISDTGLGYIWNEGQIPADCALSKSDLRTTTISCSGRPATQPWRTVVNCEDVGMGYLQAYGAAITGNGTSTAVCNVDSFLSVYFDDLTPEPPIFP